MLKNKILVIQILLGLTVFASVPNRKITADTLQFLGNELLCRPTANSITINACTNKSIDVYYEYGTDSLNYQSQTNVQTTVDSIPFNFVIKDLTPNTRYFYRMRYKGPGGLLFIARPSHTFHTARPAGEAFTFAIEADPHMDTNSLASVYTLTLQNIVSRNPDFLFDLGDTFMGEKIPGVTKNDILGRHLLMRTFFDISSHSSPLFLVQGNHDAELGWQLNGTAENMAVWNTNIRKVYYPNPQPDSFYTGDSKVENFVGLRENYYAFEWGDALFVTLDPYWYTAKKPGWGWTLGAEQYNWFKNTISTSKAKFKFVFCHNLVGGNGNDARGGSEYADYFESGGKNADSTWGWSTYRPTWDKPLHQLMVENKVNIFFHGHDHFYGKQDKDGMVYQEVPQPSSKSYTTNSAANYGYVEGVIIPSRGYLLVSINDTSAKIEYIRTYLPTEENGTRHNKDISHSYTIINKGTASGVSEMNYSPDKFTLNQNYPNPFNPETTISFEMEKQSDVKLEVFNLLGQKVSTLLDKDLSAGYYSVKFNPASLAGGVYYYCLSSAEKTKTMKMIYLK